MAMYPDVQKKAQAELDTVIGRDRLPDLDDLDSLPYINAIVKETLRWQPVVPMGESLAQSQDGLSVSTKCLCVCRCCACFFAG
jgi:cytochrome P450